MYWNFRNIASIVLALAVIVCFFMYQSWKKHHADKVREDEQRELEESAEAYRQQMKKNNELLLEEYDEDGNQGSETE